MRKQISKNNQPLIAEPPHGHDCWNLRCGGRGICSSCRVTLLQGVFNVAGKTVDVRLGMPLQANACQTTLLSDTGLIDIPALIHIKNGGLKMAQGWFSHSVQGSFYGKSKLSYDLGYVKELYNEKIANEVISVYYGALNLWCFTDGATEPEPIIMNYIQKFKEDKE